jgi:hypothetical protein
MKAIIQNAQQFLVLGLVIVLLIQVSACTPRVAGLQHDESFHYGAVMAGGLAIAGVTSTFAEFPPEQQNQLAEVFHRAIVDEREEFRLVSPGALKQKIGKEYPNILENFRVSATLGPNDLSLLQKAKIPARFLIMSRVEKHESHQTRDESSVYEDKKETDRVRVSMQSITEVTAFSNIYDLQRGVSVWSGSITQTERNENTFEPYRGDNPKKSRTEVVLDVLDVIAGSKDSDREYPAEPEFEEVAQAVFLGFAANLPKKE